MKKNIKEWTFLLINFNSTSPKVIIEQDLNDGDIIFSKYVGAITCGYDDAIIMKNAMQATLDAYIQK